jgi:hypothetical protein
MKRSRLLACLLLASALAVCQLGFFNLKAGGTQRGSVDLLANCLVSEERFALSEAFSVGFAGLGGPQAGRQAHAMQS